MYSPPQANNGRRSYSEFLSAIQSAICKNIIGLVVFGNRKFKRKIAMKKGLLARMVISPVVLLLASAIVAAQVPALTLSSPKGDVALERLEREVARLSRNSG